MSVDFKHPDYTKNFPLWKTTNDICDSENLQAYIVKKNPTDSSPENIAENKQLFERAIFSAITGYTSRGFVGQIYAKQPKITLPAELEYLRVDCDGAGNSIYQQSQDTTKDVSRIGRAGLFTDFPISDGDDDRSKADTDSGEIFSTIIKYEADQIINWQLSRVGSKNKLSLIVLEVSENLIGDDDFEFEQVPLILELRLTTTESGDTAFVIQEWRKSIENSDEWAPGGYSDPLEDGFGKRWTEIPFKLCGSESNTPRVDRAPMHDMAKINIGHFNNSAIYEDSVFIVGQAQPWMSGLTNEYIKEAAGMGMYFGSGRLIGVPAGEKLGIEQAAPNTLAKEAMADKIDLMIGIGAMYMQPGSAVKTATQSAGEQRTQHSVMSLVAANVSAAYEQSIAWAAQYMGVIITDENMEFKLNGDFVDPDADAQTIMAVTNKFLSNALPISDYLKWEQKHGFVDPEKTLEEFSKEIDSGSGFDLSEGE